MNETLKVIKERRSVRLYKSEQVKLEELKEVVEAGIYAPSGNNKQPWHFSIVQNKGLIDEMNIKIKEDLKNNDNEDSKKLGNNEKFHVFYNAPTVIIVSGDESVYTSNMDCSAATENILLAAQSINLGTCWIGFMDNLFNGKNDDKYSEKLQIPKGYKPKQAIAIGYKKIENTKAALRKENSVSYIL